jgi:hypothetical protein
MNLSKNYKLNSRLIINKQQTKDLTSFFADSEKESIQGEYSREDQILDEIIAFLETQNIPTGGIISIDRILHSLTQGNYPYIEKTELILFINSIHRSTQFSLRVFRESAVP